MIFSTSASKRNVIASPVVIFDKLPSIDLPLALLQYESAIPAILPRPALFPSCKRIIPESAKHTIKNSIITKIFNIIFYPAKIF